MKRERVILGLLAALVLGACGTTSSAGGGNTYAGKTIKLGAILSITGAGGVYGPQSRDGMKLAVDEINKAGGVNGATIELTVNDDASDKAQSARLAQTEGREILGRQTVLENLELATWPRRDRAAAHRDTEAVMRRFPILGERRQMRASTLSGGERQLLAIARGLLAKPKLLLLDEPSLGLAPQMVDEVFGAIDEIHREGSTILLVEQNALRALEVANRAYVLETGQVQLTGTGQDLMHDPAVRLAYLGG